MELSGSSEPPRSEDPGRKDALPTPEDLGGSGFRLMASRFLATSAWLRRGLDLTTAGQEAHRACTAQRSQVQVLAQAASTPVSSVTTT